MEENKMENMDSIFDKINSKLAQVNGNVMAFDSRPELDKEDEPNVFGICTSCRNIIPLKELERNWNICDKCAKDGEL